MQVKYQKLPQQLHVLLCNFQAHRRHLRCRNNITCKHPSILLTEVQIWLWKVAVLPTDLPLLWQSSYLSFLNSPFSETTMTKSSKPSLFQILAFLLNSDDAEDRH